MRAEIVVDTRKGLAGTAAARFEELVRSTLAAQDRFSCALPGGSVAETFFPAFRSLALPWPRVHVFFGDERAVPPTDPDSNVGLARRLWLDAVPAVVHPMPSDRADLTAAAASYAAELRTLPGDPPHLDLALLGMGPDGHVCSLFPGHPLLAERTRLVAEITDSPKPPPRRLTLTLPVLAAAKSIWIAAFGDAKARAVRDAVEDPASRLPVALAARSGPPTTFLLDPDAAGGLHRTV
jgi:6-phosphogluconolactonase